MQDDVQWTLGSMNETYEQPIAPSSETPRLKQPADMAEADEHRTASSPIQEAHLALISHYVRILKELSTLRPIGGRRARQVSSGYRPFVWRSLVRLFSEQHIRRQLSALSRLYALQLGVALSRSDVEDQWLDEAQRSCEKVSGAISSWQRLKLWLAVASPIVGGFIVAGLGVDDLYAATVTTVTSEEFKARSASLVNNYGLSRILRNRNSVLSASILGFVLMQEGIILPSNSLRGLTEMGKASARTSR
jgi:hypothetical protein